MTLALLVEGFIVLCPVQFIINMYSQVLMILHNIHTDPPIAVTKLTVSVNIVEVLNALDKSKKHNPHSARWLLQVGVDTVEQVDHSILSSKSRVSPGMA